MERISEGELTSELGGIGKSIIWGKIPLTAEMGRRTDAGDIMLTTANQMAVSDS